MKVVTKDNGIMTWIDDVEFEADPYGYFMSAMDDMGYNTTFSQLLYEAVTSPEWVEYRLSFNYINTLRDALGFCIMSASLQGRYRAEVIESKFGKYNFESDTPKVGAINNLINYINDGGNLL